MLLYIQKAQTSLLLIYAQGPSNYPTSQTNNNETYADMTTYLLRFEQVSIYVIPVGIYCYFVSDFGFLIKSVRSFCASNTKRQ